MLGKILGGDVPVQPDKTLSCDVLLSCELVANEVLEVL